jgi:hypothetical protein
MADKNDWIVDGFQFGTQNDADLAQNEEMRIKKLEEKIDYDNPKMVSAVYNKAVTNRIFKTPVGYVFLKRLQDSLKQSGMEDLENIPVSGVFSLRENSVPTVEKIKASQKKPKPEKKKEFIGLRTSLVLNAVLIVLVCIMFYISSTGSNPTVLNYEKALLNRYSEWEKELSDRESVIREKEKELLINE